MFDCQRIRGFSRILSLSLCALVTVQPALAFGGEGGNCFERAADKINPGSRIDLVTTTGDRLSGRLALIDFRERVLTLEPEAGTAADSTRAVDRRATAGNSTAAARLFRLSEISRIEYRSTNSSPGWMWGGAMAGAFAGAILPVGITNDGGGAALLISLRMLGGGLAGYLIGSIVPSVTTSSHTIVCEPVIAREGP